MKTLKQLVVDFKAATKSIVEVQKNLPRIMGVICVKSVKANFKKQSYNGIGWDKRKDTTNAAYTYGRGKGGKSQYKGSVFNADNPILMQTKNLYDSIAYKVIGDAVTIGVDLTLIPYAKIHNEGGPGEAFGHPFNMPKRQYMPQPGEPPTPDMVNEIGGAIRKAQAAAMREFKK